MNGRRSGTRIPVGRSTPSRAARARAAPRPTSPRATSMATVSGRGPRNGIWFENPLPGGNRRPLPGRVTISTVSSGTTWSSTISIETVIWTSSSAPGTGRRHHRVFRNDGNDLWAPARFPLTRAKDSTSAISTVTETRTSPSPLLVRERRRCGGRRWRERPYTDSYTHSQTVVRVARVNGDSCRTSCSRSGATRRRVPGRVVRARVRPAALWSEHVIENGVETVLHSWSWRT